MAMYESMTKSTVTTRDLAGVSRAVVRLHKIKIYQLKVDAKGGARSIG